MGGVCQNDPCWDYTGNFERHCEGINDCFGMYYENGNIPTVYRRIDTTNYQNIQINFYIHYEEYDDGYGCFLDYSIDDTQNWINGVKQYTMDGIDPSELYDFDKSVNNQPINFWIRFRGTSPDTRNRCWLQEINIYADIIPPTSTSPTLIPTINPTFNPTTNTPTTSIPTTSIPTTFNPTTNMPTTSMPTTSMPTSLSPSTVEPSTNIPTSSSPTMVSSSPVRVTTTTITTSLKEPETIVIIATPDNVKVSTTNLSSTLSSTSNDGKKEVKGNKQLDIMPIIIGGAILLCAVLLCIVFIVYRYRCNKSKAISGIELAKVTKNGINSNGTHSKINSNTLMRIQSIESEDVCSTPNGESAVQNDRGETYHDKNKNCNNNDDIRDEDEDDDEMYDNIGNVDETPNQTPMQTPITPANIPSIGEQEMFDNFTKGNIVTLTTI